MPQPTKGELNERQRRFCEEYIANGFNALDAYNKVYGEKANKAKPSYPYTLLTYPKIKEYIKKRRQEIYDALNIDAIRIAQELAEMAFASKKDAIYVPSVKLRALELLSKNLGLQTQKIEKSEVIEISLEGEEEENNDENAN